MNTGRIEVICGSDGSGKTAMAFGKALYALSQQKQVIVIQFLKGCGKRQDSPDIFKRLEPELKVFRFEKSDHYYESLTPDEKEEECCNIKNGLNYARKVLTTGECDLLILDEIFGLVDYNIITIEELMDLIAVKKDSMDLILTGRNLPDEVREIADCVYSIQREKEKTPEILAQGNF